MAGVKYTKTARWHANHPPAPKRKPRVRVAWLVIVDGALVTARDTRDGARFVASYSRGVNKRAVRVVRATYTLPQGGRK